MVEKIVHCSYLLKQTKGRTSLCEVIFGHFVLHNSRLGVRSTGTGFLCFILSGSPPSSDDQRALIEIADENDQVSLDINVSDHPVSERDLFAIIVPC